VKDMAAEVAELIMAESQSGSASWDELNGPDSELRTLPDGYQVILPEGWVEDFSDDSYSSYSNRWCIITIKMADTKP
jgi:hypothetical protein